MNSHNKNSNPTRIILCFVFLALMPAFVQAQQSITLLETVAEWVTEAVRVIFLIGITIGIARTVILFIQGSPNAVRTLVFTIIAAIVYFGFSALIGDIQGIGDIGDITN